MSDKKKTIEIEVPTLEIGSGRQVDVLIEDYETPERSTGEMLYRRMMGIEEMKTLLIKLTVWADAGLKNRFEEIDGIMAVEKGQFSTQYIITLDPRYERDWVAAEIKAAALVPQEEQQAHYVGKVDGFGIRDTFSFSIKDNDSFSGLISNLDA